MPANTGNEDTKSRKTEKALDIALSSLLNIHNFNKITVKDICEEALVSRASFYAHYLDKYDLLKAWLICLKPDSINDGNTYEQIETSINQFIYKNKIVIKNVAYGANEETSAVLFNFMLSTLNFTVNNHDKANPKNTILASFYGGGMVCYLLWLIDNKFPSDVAPMNKYLYEIIKSFQKWQSE